MTQMRKKLSTKSFLACRRKRSKLMKVMKNQSTHKIIYRNSDKNS